MNYIDKTLSEVKQFLTFINKLNMAIVLCAQVLCAQSVKYLHVIEFKQFDSASFH